MTFMDIPFMNLLKPAGQRTFVFPFPFSSTLAVKIAPKGGSGTMSV